MESNVNVNQPQMIQNQIEPPRDRVLEMTMLGVSVLFVIKLIACCICLSLMFMAIGMLLFGLRAAGRRDHHWGQPSHCPDSEVISYEYCLDFILMKEENPEFFEFVISNVTIEECASFIRHIKSDFYYVDWYDFSMTKKSDCYSTQYSSESYMFKKYIVDDYKCNIPCRQDPLYFEDEYYEGVYDRRMMGRYRSNQPERFVSRDYHEEFEIMEDGDDDEEDNNNSDEDDIGEDDDDGNNKNEENSSDGFLSPNTCGDASGRFHSIYSRQMVPCPVAQEDYM